MKLYLDSDETNIMCDENTPLNANDEESHDTEKLDPPGLTDKVILIEEKIGNYAITNLPKKIIEMILVDTVKSSRNSTGTYY